MSRLMTVFAVLVALSAVAAGVTVYLLRGTPQYSLAMMVYEAHVPGGHGVERYIDIDRVVDRFIPQVRDKAVELYGRGIPPKAIAEFERFAEPLKPLVKARARAEFTPLLKESTVELKKYPTIVLAAGMWWRTGTEKREDEAVLRAKLPDGADIEVVMVRVASRWRIVEIKHPQLAQKIAGTVGQELLAIAYEEGLDGIGRNFGIKDIDGLMERIDEALR